MLQYLPGFGSVTVLASDFVNFVDIYIPGIFRKFRLLRDVWGWWRRRRKPRQWFHWGTRRSTKPPNAVGGSITSNSSHVLLAANMAFLLFLAHQHCIPVVPCNLGSLYVAVGIFMFFVCLIIVGCSVLNLILLSLFKERIVLYAWCSGFCENHRLQNGLNCFYEQLRQCADTQVLATCHDGNVPSTFDAKQPYGP